MQISADSTLPLRALSLGHVYVASPSLQRRRQLQITVLARNQALHYLANHPLTPDERAQLTEIVHGYTGPCDIVAAREGLAWLRERYRERGEQVPF